MEDNAREFEGKGVGRREVLKALAVFAVTPAIAESSAQTEDKHASSTGPLSSIVAGTRAQAFDKGWRFLRGDAMGAEAPGFDDSRWRMLDLPHDWSVEELPDRGGEENGEGALWGISVTPIRVGPFDTELSEGGRDTGWVVGGTGWYRRHFSAASVPSDGQVEIVFDGVYKNSDVWLNGTLLGNHPYGYTTFSYDLTPHLRRDGENVVAVRVRNEGKNSRWYSGSGIYRHVWLNTTGKLRIPIWGVCVTSPEVSPEQARVDVAVKVENRMETAREVIIRTRLLDRDNASVGTHEAKQSVAAGEIAEVHQQIDVRNPNLWSQATPHLYRAETELVLGEAVADHAATTFGIRSVEVDAEHGLRINGQSVKLKGGCVHHDNGLLGACAIDRAEERRVELMKANGFNAIRTSHNPPSPAFLGACDRLGILVLDEAFDQWEEEKNPDDYHLDFAQWWQRDMSSMILRDRNHPCVILWSLGNEIPERLKPRGIEIARELSAFAKKLDPTRPITAAINNSRGDSIDPAFQYLDVAGYNYLVNSYEEAHGRFPSRVIVGTESFPRLAFQNWEAVEKFPYVIGDFVWTGMDYLGESAIGNAQLDSPRQGGPPPANSGAVATQQAQAAAASGGTPPSSTPPSQAAAAVPAPSSAAAFFINGSSIRLPFPWFNSYCGDIDLIGETKPQGFYRRVLWGTSKLEMAVQRPVPVGRTEIISAWGWSDELRSWTWPGFEGRTVKVRVASSGDQVRLILNGKEIGSKAISRETELRAEFEVPYSPGEIRAIALEGGREIGQIAYKTAGKPAKLGMRADRSTIRRDPNDLSFVKVEVLDQSGNVVPDAAVSVALSVSGAGRLAAAGTANPKDVASFRSRRPMTYHGKCLAIVQPLGQKGSIVVRAESPGLGSASIQLTAL